MKNNNPPEKPYFSSITFLGTASGSPSRSKSIKFLQLINKNSFFNFFFLTDD